jgi:hypothetical protein
MRFILFFLIVLPAFLSASPPDTIWSGKTMIVKKKNWKYYYDHKNRLITKKRNETFFRKGFVTYYDTLGNMTSCGRLKLGQRSGKWREFKYGEYISVRYKYGIDKKLLYTSEGKYMTLVLDYGFGAHTDRSEKYRAVLKPVAGCIVTNKVLFYCWLHNSIAELRLDMKYGKKWREELTYGL